MFGTISLFAVLAFPALFAQGARLVQRAMLEKTTEQIAGTDLWLVPVLGVAAFVILFWALRGMKALGQLKLPKPPKVAPSGAAA